MKLRLVGDKPTKRPMRRLSDRLRLIADEVWDRGDKELSSHLHQCARDATRP